MKVSCSTKPDTVPSTRTSCTLLDERDRQLSHDTTRALAHIVTLAPTTSSTTALHPKMAVRRAHGPSPMGIVQSTDDGPRFSSSTAAPARYVWMCVLASWRPPVAVARERLNAAARGASRHQTATHAPSTDHRPGARDPEHERVRHKWSPTPRLEDCHAWRMAPCVPVVTELYIRLRYCTLLFEASASRKA